MAEPFIGEIRLFANQYAPKGWALCEGQVLPINTNQALYSLIGNVYGGNGVTTFALPDLRGRTPVHFASNIPLGTAQGEAAHTLSQNEMPMHTHIISGSSVEATGVSPLNQVWGEAAGNPYSSGASDTEMNAGSITSAGSGQPHNNMQPFLVVNFCIALIGIFPSRN